MQFFNQSTRTTELPSNIVFCVSYGIHHCQLQALWNLYCFYNGTFCSFITLPKMGFFLICEYEYCRVVKLTPDWRVEFDLT